MCLPGRGITLIALVITIIVLLILAGITINLTVGQNGILNRATDAKKSYKIADIIEKLEVEKSNLIIELAVNLPSVNEYVNYLINKNIINEVDVTHINDDTKEIVIDNYVFLIEKEESGNIKISYSGPATTEPRIRRIEIVETTVGSIKVKVIASKVENGDYKYYIKNITTGEEYKETPTATLKENEYEFTDLERENRYKIKVELVNNNGKTEKETEEIETVPTKVNSITLNKTSIEMEKGATDTTLKLTINPNNVEDKSVTWTSSDESVAKVEVTEDIITITGIDVGNANIVVTANDGSGKSATCKVTVTLPPPPTIGEIGSVHEAKQIPDEWDWKVLGEIAKAISDNYGDEEGKINKDTVEITITARGITTQLGIGDWKTVNAKKVRILGFNHDNLVTSTTNEDGVSIPWAQYGMGTTNTKAGISFEYIDLMSGNMNSSNTNSGGWGQCTIRQTLNATTIKNLENKTQIKRVVKEYAPTFRGSQVMNSEDYLWLLSTYEIFGNSEEIRVEGEQYRIYKDGLPGKVKNPNIWYCRSVASDGKHYLAYHPRFYQFFRP